MHKFIKSDSKNIYNDIKNDMFKILLFWTFYS